MFCQWNSEQPPPKQDFLECYHVLYGLASALNAQTYLEIGVREGASLCCAIAKEPEIANFALRCLSDGRQHLSDLVIEHISRTFTPRCNSLKLYLFDNWSYEDSDGGHQRIINLLEDGFRMNHYRLFDGDSKKTVPAFFKEHTEKIDLAFVDGDHEVEGATADLENIVDHAKVLVVHDLFHPQHEYMEDLFVKFARRHGLPYFIVGRRMMGTGVAFNFW